MNNGAFDAISFILVTGVSVAIVVTVHRGLKQRSNIILQGWADANDIQIVETKWRWNSTGPFKWWTNGRNQTVYYLKVRDRDGRKRSGWARCGSFFGGVEFSNKIEVRWEDA
jgi:hypothetical protein